MMALYDCPHSDTSWNTVVKCETCASDAPEMYLRIAKVEAEREVAVQLLIEEHEAHHSLCCVTSDDLCHIGQFLARKDT